MTCSCGGPGEFSSCCGPILSGERAAQTAEQLMRARYSAYARCEVDFLKTSLIPEERGAFDPKGAEEWSKQAEWQGMEVLRTKAGGPNDTEGTVEFVARYKMKDQDVEHHELATFRKDDGAWLFVDGKTPSAEPYRRPTPKVGANDPCPCSSGRKFKKCCGKVA